MKAKKLLLVVTNLLMTMSLLIGCAPKEAASGPSKSALAPEITLYLCSNDNGNVLTANCATQPDEYSTEYSYPKYGTKLDFAYPLEGDITGKNYTFNLWLASTSKSTMDATLIVQQAGKETRIASASFNVTGDTFKAYTQTVTGTDPSTAKGDILILRITASAGDPGGVITRSVPEKASSITIPGTNPAEAADDNSATSGGANQNMLVAATQSPATATTNRCSLQPRSFMPSRQACSGSSHRFQQNNMACGIDACRN